MLVVMAVLVVMATAVTLVLNHHNHLLVLRKPLAVKAAQVALAVKAAMVALAVKAPMVSLTRLPW